MSEESEKNTANVLGRNEPCPCGSGKKYKRCCGVSAAPKLSAPAAGAPGMPGAPGGFDPAAMGMDQAKMMEVAQAMQRLPKGQLQRIQGLMQKAMAGKDVSREAADFEQTLPVEFQQMLRALQPSLGAAASAAPQPEPASSEMTEELARELVAKAAAEGKIAADEAQKLLGDSAPAEVVKAKTGKFWKPFFRK